MDQPSDAHVLPPLPRKPRRRIAVITLLLLAVAFACGPWVISKTVLRDTVLSLVIGEPDLQVSATDASFGWFSPLTVDGLQLRTADNTTIVNVDQLRAEKSWLALWLSSPALGRIDVQRPRIDLTVAEDAADEAAQLPLQTEVDFAALPTFTAAITAAQLTVRAPDQSDPVVDLRDVDITLRIERGESGPLLSVDPLTVFDHEKLSPELCNDGLQLVAPMLANEVSVEGELSFELKRLRVPLGSQVADREDREMEIEGLVVLHHVVGGIENPITKGLAMMAGDLLGLGAVPERVRLADEAKIEFHVRDGRLHHQGMTLVFPEISPEFSLQTSGSVGFDESLDLQVAVQVPQELLGPTVLGEALARAPITLQVTGTLDEPKLGLPDDQNWVARLSDRLLSAEASAEVAAEEGQLAGQIMTMVGKLLEKTDDQPAPIGSQLLERIEQRRKRLQETESQQPPTRGRWRQRIEERRERRVGQE